MKVLVCITLVALLCCAAKGGREKKLNVRTVKQEGESCELGSIPWGTCSQEYICPAASQLNCAENLNCCRPVTAANSADDTTTEVEEKAYDKFLRDVEKYYS